MRKLWLVPVLIFSFAAHAAARTWSQLAIGGGFQAVILISNKTGSDWTGQFFPKQGFERPWAGTWQVNGQNYTGQTFFNVGLHAYGTAKFVLTGDDSLPVQTGYLFLWGTGNSSAGDVTVDYFYQFFRDGKLVMSAGTTEGNVHAIYSFPVEYSPTGVNTGIAWAPEIDSTPSTPFKITASLYVTNESGVAQLYGSKNLSFSGHAAQFINEIFPELSGSGFRGYAVLTAEHNVCLEVLRMDSVDNGFLLTSTPPAFVSSP
jgi:hypothetical protein